MALCKVRTRGKGLDPGKKKKVIGHKNFRFLWIYMSYIRIFQTLI